ncbi:N-acetylmuramoyl-L-alanine amidase [Bacillaceae bacterium Marseille-Q3522]|nr:N-acetylmuramoyl-L-alanine amidase [Bacillaceae bacterium Marseille-Q3522]
MVKFFIDPGHGGSDPGAVANGIQEKNITLQIATRVRDILLGEYNNASVLMSRTGDQTVSLGARTNAANNWGANYYLSIHINAGGGTGFESYTYPGVGTPTTTYQNIVHADVLEQVDFADRGKKQANFHVLRESNMPAILTENGFIDRVEDANKLKNSSFIESLARGHVNGLAGAFGLPKKDTAVYHIVVAGDTVWSLSRQYGSTVEEIRIWNNLDSNYTIYVGQRLRVK